ncbi:MAG: two-component system response regulator NarL [Gammaproteobacteria bacterium]|jgi:two-component system nitrate/nitrite response regulator NarL|nr:two-component system response regulator NarL [Gammaproteobacteria bacterium]MBT3488638.1 two-component system response regulator NarL [Gammaproteobacteria bacterium]MBT3718257.1 two-component system response regulator NarL [Gammaproteobacteria bacterium]MBT3846117.1 two-component system response regulator NarL [Gammaproteobacteria bacterium]MBT3893718.1 two-component system response regulator NarL [Gammaproteobacteria bacterium]
MDQPNLIKIIIIDDHPLFRKGVKNLLSMNPLFTVIGEAANGDDGIQLAIETSPDLILLDIDMKGMNGIETLTLLKQERLPSKVIMLSVSNHESDVLDALRSGADGYLLKDMEPEQILEKIEQAADGHTVISEQLTTLLAKSIREDHLPPHSSAEAELTNRETEILRLVMDGKSNKVVARQLDISDGTVKVHMKNILKKLQLKTRVEAAVWAIKNLES